MAQRVVIVGAGPGGLASAMIAASRGAQVTLLERLPFVGGRTSTLSAEGYVFDRGPTFFLYPDVLRGIFESCGRRLEDEIELKRLDPNYRLVFGVNGDRLDAWTDPGRLKAEVAKIAPADAENIENYMATNREKFGAFRPFLERPFESVRDLLGLGRLLPVMRPWASVDQDLGRYFADPRIRLAFSFQSKYLGMSPFKCPSLFTILAFLEHEFGVHHPVGGCGAVSETMARVAGEMGVDIRLNEAVEAVDFKGRRATAVATASGRYPCDALVINADFAQAMRSLVPNELRKRWSDEKLAHKKYSCSTFMLYLGIDRQYRDLAHHTIVLAEDYKEHLARIEQGGALPKAPSFYLHNPVVSDATMAPEGHSALYVLVPVAHLKDGIDWRREQAAFREQTLDQLEALGLTDIRQRIKFERVFTPRDWAGEMALYKGATFSLSHTLDQMLSFRPRNRFEELEGVYLTGGGTHPGSGLPVIYESAKISMGLMAKDLGLAEPLVEHSPSAFRRSA